MHRGLGVFAGRPLLNCSCRACGEIFSEAFSSPLPFLPHCSMFGGSIQGTFRELIPHSRIVMDWRFSNWTDDVYSRVEVDIEEASKGDVRLKLQQSGIPSSDRYGNHDVQGTTLHGWRAQVFQRIRQVFGYGM